MPRLSRPGPFISQRTGKPKTAWPAHAAILVTRRTALIRVEQRNWGRCLVEAFADEIPHLLYDQLPLVLMEDRMRKPREHLEPFDG
jgi:hypothetical protein